MGGGVDGDAEGGAGADHLLGGGYYFGIFEDCGAEFLLDIADAVRGVLEGMIGTEGWRGVQESGILWYGGVWLALEREHTSWAVLTEPSRSRHFDGLLIRIDWREKSIRLCRELHWVKTELQDTDFPAAPPARNCPQY